MSALRLAAGLLALVLSGSAAAVVPELAETREIHFTDADSQSLVQTAAAAGNPVAIYEGARNLYDFAAYYGSRSNSTNSFLGERSNDVDSATMLIAMFRSQGILARYAVGTVQISSVDLMNWLQVRNVDLAIQILTSQGVQAVAKSADGTYVTLEHAWVEAYVFFDGYRGTASAGCPANPTTGCAWVGLDPSFKHYTSKVAPIDIYGTLPFDYTSYYNAIKNQDAARLNKNPLEIYQEQILTSLQTTNPGKTLEDVKDIGTVIPEVDGVLPASLPLTPIGTIRRYNSVADHDAAVGTVEAKKWGMQVKVTVQTETKDATTGLPTYDLYGNPIPNLTLINARTYYLSDLSTQRLTLSFGDTTKGCTTPVGTICAILRMNGVIDTTSTVTATTSDIFIISLALDGAPATTVGGVDGVISATYYNSISNGYYLIGTGGDTSNWSQTHRAAERLLGVSNPAGVTGTSDPVLVDEVTGGLLQTAMTLYYAKFHDSIVQLNALNHVVSPIQGFVGVVSSVYDLQYYAGTAFGVLPGGLLIDMKGQRLAGVWRNNAANTNAPDHFLLIGHTLSSLEHEIWQELTGFDAVSTVRGIQMALAQTGAQIVNPKNTPASNIATELPKFALTNNANLATAGYVLSNIFLSGQPGNITTWYASDYYNKTLVPQGAAADLSFDALKISNASTDPAWRKGLLHYNYPAPNYTSFYDALYCYSHHDQAFHLAQPNGTGPAFQYFSWQTGSTTSPPQALMSGTPYGVYTCGFATGTQQYIVGYPYSTSAAYPTSLWTQERAEFLSFVSKYATYMSYFDAANASYPFVTTDFFYRSASANPNTQTLGIVASIRDNLAGTQKLEYLLPSQRTVTTYNQFLVYLAKTYDATGVNLTNLSFIIQNWGGGFVSADHTLRTQAANGEH